MMFKLPLLLLFTSGLVHSMPHYGSQVFNPEPRPGHVDWNAPRPNQGAFLAKRSDVHTEEYFNNPLINQSSLVQPTKSGPLHALSGRATSGQWENLEGSGSWHPAPVSWGGPRLDVYYMGKDKTCKHKYREGSGSKWGSWEDLGGSLDSAPACCSRKKDNMHVFCKGTDGQAWHRSYDTGGGWGRWQSMGGNLKHYPSTCSWDKDHVSVYVSSYDDQCWHRRYDDKQGGWYSWENIGGYLDGPPKAVTWGKGHTSIFCKGQDGQAWHKKYDSAWSDWESLGGSLDGEPAACAWDGRMDVFVKGTDGACWHKTYKGGWGSWANLGGKMKSGKAPDVVVYGGKIEVYIIGDDNAVYRKVWEKEKWTADWEYMGGNVETKPSAVAWDDGKVDVYAGASDGSCRRCY